MGIPSMPGDLSFSIWFIACFISFLFMGFISCSLCSISTFFGMLFSNSFWVSRQFFCLLYKFWQNLWHSFRISRLVVFVFLFDKNIYLVFLHLRWSFPYFLLWFLVSYSFQYHLWNFANFLCLLYLVFFFFSCIMLFVSLFSFMFISVFCLM